MGQISSKKPKKRILIHGMHQAGKSAVLQKFADMFDEETRHEFFEEILTHNKVEYSSWHHGGRCSSRSLYNVNLRQVLDAVIYVIDSTDSLELVQFDLSMTTRLYEKGSEFRKTAFLILCNKQDLPDAVGSSEVAEILNVDETLKTIAHTVHIMECSAVTGEGLREALDWLSQELAIPLLTPPVTEDEQNIKDVASHVKETEQKKTGWSIKSCMRGSFDTFKAALSKK